MSSITKSILIIIVLILATEFIYFSPSLIEVKHQVSLEEDEGFVGYCDQIDGHVLKQFNYMYCVDNER